MKLSSERSFSEKVMKRYLKMTSRFRAMPQMIFREEAARFFSCKLNMLFTMPVQVMNRYCLFSRDVHPSLDQAVSARPFTMMFSPAISDAMRRGFRAKRGAQNALAAHGAIAVTSWLGYALKAADAATQVFSSFGNDRSAIFRSPSPAAVQRGQSENQTRYAGETRTERTIPSFTQQFIRHAHGTFIDQFSKKQSILGEELRRRHERPVLALRSATGVAHAASGRCRKSLGGEDREFIFIGAEKVGREIDELKRIVKESEDQVREKVMRQVGELGARLNQQVDIGQLTHQVCRNMERIIRIERERRGM